MCVTYAYIYTYTLHIHTYMYMFITYTHAHIYQASVRMQAWWLGDLFPTGSDFLKGISHWLSGKERTESGGCSQEHRPPLSSWQILERCQALFSPEPEAHINIRK